MDLRICEYCGMEYSAQESICPICGRPASPSATVIPGTEAKAEKKQPGARLAKGGKFAAKKGAQRSAQPARTESAQPAQPAGGNPYGIPKWMMGLICALLALAVIAGALFALYSIGYFTDFVSLTHEAQSAPTVQQPAETQTQGATEQQYINEEDYTPDETEDIPQDLSVPCTGIRLDSTSVTFQETEQFFNVAVTVEPAGCTEPSSIRPVTSWSPPSTSRARSWPSAAARPRSPRPAAHTAPSVL